MSYIHPAAAEHLRKRWLRPDAYRFAAPGTPEAKRPGYLHPWAAVARAEDEARWAAEDEAFEREALQRKLWDLRRQLDEVKCELAAKRAAERREAEELRIKSDLAFERFRRALMQRAEQQKAGFDPDQPRVPSGNSDGGQWTGDGGEGARRDVGRMRSTDISAARRSGPPRGATVQQQLRLDLAAARAQEAVSRVQQLQPDWRPTPSFTARDSVEGMIRAKEAETREAEARFIALSRAGQDTPYPLRDAPTTAEVLAPRGRPIGARDPDVNARNVRILSSEEFETVRTTLMSNARRIEPDVRYDGVWYEREDGTRFGLRLSVDHGLTLEVVRGGYYLPNNLKFHQR